MTTRLNPYLNFGGNAREAMEFYQHVFGGDLDLQTYEQMPGSDPGEHHKIMHGMLTTPSGFVLMGADAPGGAEVGGSSSISVSLSGDDEPELRGYWDSLTEGATILEPLVEAPWGDLFGMLSDRFGVTWLVNVGEAGS